MPIFTLSPLQQRTANATTNSKTKPFTTEATKEHEGKIQEVLTNRIRVHSRKFVAKNLGFFSGLSIQPSVLGFTIVAGLHKKSIGCLFGQVPAWSLPR